MSWHRDLDQLRAGVMTFDRFAVQHRGRFRRWAGYFFERWPQRALDIDDLVQEGLITAWSAVDRWDPARGVDLARFVEYQVGAKMDRDLRQAVGWPSKTKPRIWCVSIDDATTTDRQAPHPTPERRLMNRQVVDQFDGIERDALAGMSLGMPLRAIAAHMYRDPDARILHRFDSPDDAIRQVRRAIKRASKTVNIQLGEEAT